jgi:hypothetical protein
MALICAAFITRHTRLGHTGLMVLFSLLSGFALYFIRNLALILGESGQWPMVTALWAPPLAGLLMALGGVVAAADRRYRKLAARDRVVLDRARADSVQSDGVDPDGRGAPA